MTSTYCIKHGWSEISMITNSLPGRGMVQRGPFKGKKGLDGDGNGMMQRKTSWQLLSNSGVEVRQTQQG
jgi:hypothetical protein